jgi:hypothetical protein
VSNNGDLTAAQKLLLQKFPQLPDDDPLIELAAWNASLEQKVDDFGSRLDVWTNAILKQTDLATQQNQLIVSQNLTLQETAKNNAALGQSLLQFKQVLTQLQQEFKTLKSTISEHGNTLTNLSYESQSLSKKLDQSDLKLKLLDGNISHLKTSLNFKSIQWTPLILAVAIGGLCLFFGSQQGFKAGQLDVASKWFGGIENLDYWRQVRNLNKVRTAQCLQQGQTECPVRLP